jgi:hypothetical protein
MATPSPAIPSSASLWILGVQGSLESIRVTFAFLLIVIRPDHRIRRVLQRLAEAIRALLHSRTARPRRKDRVGEEPRRMDPGEGTLRIMADAQNDCYWVALLLEWARLQEIGRNFTLNEP